MTAWICARCGVQYADTPEPERVCGICADEREALPPTGQRWTTLGELTTAGHRTMLHELEPGLLGLGVEPEFAIGQRGLLIRTPDGNILWDPPGYLDEAAVRRVGELGGLAAIATSHPHLHGAQVEWSRAFDGAPVFVPEANRHWITRPDPAVVLWSGVHEVLPGVTLIHCGGHFPGSSVLHWRDGADGRGVLCVGDTIELLPPGRVTFIYSFVNLLPLSARSVEHIVSTVTNWQYDRLYGVLWSKMIPADGQMIVKRSAERYLQLLHGKGIATVAPANIAG